MGKNPMPLWERPTYVYRAFSPTGLLLYVGISDDWRLRLKGHSTASPWHRYALNLRVEKHENRALALAVESWALAYESPLWNSEPQRRLCPFILPLPLETFERRVYQPIRWSND